METSILLDDGSLFDMADTDYSLITTENVIASLSNTFRFNGQGISVLQHVLNCHHRAVELNWSKETQLACLHHDDMECITGDIPTPLKNICPEVGQLCNTLEAGYAAYKDLPLFATAVTSIDREQCANEIEDIRRGRVIRTPPGILAREYRNIAYYMRWEVALCYIGMGDDGYSYISRETVTVRASQGAEARKNAKTALVEKYAMAYESGTEAMLRLSPTIVSVEKVQS